MKDKYFIDTNILVYANDRSEKQKQKRAQEIIFDGIAKENIVISSQVLSEFYVTVTKKIKTKLKAEVARKQIELLKIIDVIAIDLHLVIHAVHISEKHKLSYWDALIIAAAQKAKCNVLYTEDLNPGQMIDGVTILNPFE